jgi:post-segregation antitoxin (ccd killing protein)
MERKIVYAVRLSVDVKAALDTRAKALGVDTSTLARAALSSAATMPVQVRTITVKASTPKSN